MSAKVNLWTMRTLELAEKGDYLDKLLEIYPAELPPDRPLREDIKKEIKNLYEAGKYEDLVIRLLDLERPFPVEHPYAALLRHLDKSRRIMVMKRNPQVVKVLADLLASLGLNNIIKGVERPKDINRVLGVVFKNWVKNKFTREPFRIVGGSRNLLRCNTDKEICIFVGSDEEIGSFVREYLESKKLELERLSVSAHFFYRDILINVRGIFILGEARFLSTPGGSQSRDLENTLTFVETMEKISALAKNRGIEIKGIALLDGIVWFYRSYVETIRQRATGDKVVMSALFLEEYLLSFLNKIS
ncbi:MAG: hypothetical protein LM583_08855 [Desulfurococcaceae archaeon]|nr:hypothetical protein [Desulfurococcaceae archaeon]MCL7384607.1 hypothetical protein [Candidatus Geocrenenecus arthurdayi]